MGMNAAGGSPQSPAASAPPQMSTMGGMMGAPSMQAPRPMQNPQAGAQGGAKPGGAPGMQKPQPGAGYDQGGATTMGPPTGMPGNSGNWLSNAVGVPSDMAVQAQQAAQQNGGINPQSGLPWGQHPGGVSPSQNPQSPFAPGGRMDPFGQRTDMYRYGEHAQAGENLQPGPGRAPLPGMGGFVPNRTMAPRSNFDANAMITQRPDDYSGYLSEVAQKGMVSPPPREAQSYGVTQPVQQKKGGK